MDNFDWLSAPSAPKTLLFDLETRSRVDLKAAGHRRYAADPSTNITTAAWMWKGSPNSLAGAVFLPKLCHLGSHTPFDFIMSLMEADRVVCHNAGFDISVIAQTLRYVVPAEKISCTMARAQRVSLPGGLDDVAKALGVPGKSTGGNLLVMRTCKPQRDGTFCEDEDTFRGLLSYNLQDVRAMADVDARLPELPPSERRIWERTWRKNERGLPIDIELARAVASRRQVIEIEVANRLRGFTNGAVTAVTQRQRINTWLSSIGVPMLNLRKETIEEALENEEIPFDAFDVLTMLVESGGMAPTKALSLLERQVGGFYKDGTRYFGTRSGRGTSEGVNTFNIARPSGDYDIEATIGFLKRGATAGEIRINKETKARELCLLNNTALSDVLRGLVCAPPGYAIIDADLSNIEFRLAMWFADAKDLLDELRKKDGDPYIFNARKMFNLPPDATKKTHPKERNDAKPVVLGGNYQMGWKRFYALYRRKIKGLTPAMAQAWIDSYRRANPALSAKDGLWKGLDTAARAALWRPETIVEAAGGRLAFCYSIENPWPMGAGDSLALGGQRVLRLRLPSGRTIPHYAPTIDRDTGEMTFVRGKHGRMLPQRAYGGSWVEIACQSAARDTITLVEQQIEDELPDVTLLLDIYDSVVALAPVAVAEQRLEQILTIMRRPVPWAPGLPLDGEGYTAERMKK